MKTITVLFVPYLSNLYGSERSLFTLASGLQAVGHIKPVVLLPCEGPLTTLIRDVGIRVIVHRYYGWIGKKYRILRAVTRLVLNFVALLSLSRKVRALKPDVVYTNTLATPFGAMISLRFGIPHIWHAREFVHEDLNADYDFGTRLSMALVEKSVKIICNSKAVRKKLSKAIDKDILQVVYNGFEFNLKNSTSDNNASRKYDRCVCRDSVITLLTLSSIHPGKGHEDAIRALSVLVSKGHNVKLSIAGSGDDKYVVFLKSMAKKLLVEDRVLWHGFIDDSATLLADAAVVLMCSRSEAFGRVAVEALAAGTPVVGTNSGGLPEIIDHNVTGLLYQPGNYEELAEQIERLLVNRELYEEIVQRGRQSVIKKFSIDQYVSGVQTIIEGVSE